MNRVDYDYAAQVVIAGDIVCFGLSTDDTVRALDLATGRERWHFISGGPVRFAPQIVGDRVYFAADDGVVYCLSAATGRLVWRKQLAPWPDRMSGNARMISRWPCRTGVVVVGQTVFASAGLFPSDGIYVYALDSRTGDVQWVNGNGGFLGAGFVDSPDGNHQGEFVFRGVTPEGASLFSDGVLLLPQGHANPVRIDASTGEFWGKSVKMGESGAAAVDKVIANITAKGDRPPVPEQIQRAKRTRANRGFGRPGSGGTWVTIDGGMYYVMAMHRNRITYLNAWTIREGAPWENRHSDKSLPQLTKEGVHRTVAPGRVSVVVKDGKIIGRNAYDVIVAGDSVVQGHRDAVSVSDMETGKERWRASVHGEARGLAAAGGRLIVSTDRGEITCFAPGAGAGGTISGSASSQRLTPTREDDSLIDRIRRAGMDIGYGLIVGDPGGRLARVIVERTDLHVIHVPGDERRVMALRENLLLETSLYGSRVHVTAALESKKLPFAQYCMNAIVVTARDMVSPAELYRVLRPCGGILLAPGCGELLDGTGAAPGELAADSVVPALIRGQLPGANDFDNRVSDPLVRWPLQPLWFGGPDPRDMADDRGGELFATPPTAAYGRYLVQGATSVSAVDAYNGTTLWTRRMPKPYGDTQTINGRLRNIKNVAPHVSRVKMHWRQRLARRMSITRENAYVTMGPVYFHDAGTATVLLDIRTGAQKMFAGPYVKGPQISLERPRTWLLQIPDTAGKPPAKAGESAGGAKDDMAAPLEDSGAPFGIAVASEEEGRRQMNAESGLLTMSADDAGLTLRLITRDPAVTEFDIWELFFDFRPREQRYGLYGRGTFAVQVIPAVGDAGPRIVYRDQPHPECSVTGRSTDNGTRSQIRLGWKEVEKLIGRKPESFDFAARLYADDTGSEFSKPIRMRQLFGLARPAGLNAAWATMWLGSVPSRLGKPAVVRELSELPADRNAPSALTTGNLDPAIVGAQREHPLTGDMGPKLYRSGTWSCGGPAYSASCVFRRPSKPAIGVYDFADDSGLRFLGGASSACGSSAAAVLGLLIHSDSRFRCDCNPPVKTSVAFAPAEREYNEDWAVFFDREVNTRVRHASINLGAFGDRRDRGRKLWLALPRDFDRGYGYALTGGQSHKAVMARDVGSYAKHVPAGLLVPAAIEFDESFGPYRRSSDRVVVRGTKRPWLYASGIEGIRKITMKLDFLDPIEAAKASGIVVDGKMDEPAWSGDPQVSLVDTETRVFLRCDAENLYVGAKRAALVDRKGKALAWAKATSGEDADVWKDDSLEVFLGDMQDAAVVHLGIAASGATYDARAGREGTEDRSWRTDWRSAARAAQDGMVIECALPLSALSGAGLDLNQLGINVMMNKSDTRGDAYKWLGGEGRNWRLKTPTSEALGRLGSHGRARCSHFAPLGLGRKPVRPQRKFAVHLYFAEIDPVEPGERVFSVEIQGRTALKNFDIVKAAGDVRKAVARGFKGVTAGEDLTIEFLSDSGAPPLLSGFEILEEQAPR